MRSIDITKIQEIRDMRSAGNSIPEISKKLSLPKSTVFRYVQGVMVLPQYQERLNNRRNASKIISERAKSVAFTKAESLINDLNSKELALIGASLYWAEGGKNDFSFTNTDPEMIKVFLESLRKVFMVKNSEIKVSVRIYEDLNEDECVKFWLKTTGLDMKEKVSVHLQKGRKNGKLKYGMCRIRVKKPSLLLKTIFAINKRVGELISPRSSMDRASHS